MLASSFTDILTEVSVFIIFGVAVLAAAAILWMGAYRFGEWGYGNRPTFVRAWGAIFVAVLIAIPITAGFITLGISIWGDETPDTFSTSGGQGPETICWYELVDDDTVIMAGKTPVIVDGEETRTVCAKTPLAVPDEVKNGEK